MLHRLNWLILLPLLLNQTSMAAETEDESERPREEVLVSAFRESSVRDIDASVSVIPRQTIESAALINPEELISLVPNMNLSGEGSRARYFQLRGIGELEQYEGAPNPSIGFIVDDIDLSGVGGVTSLFGVQ
jgi:outer membrane receptor for ferrienterochelin and colicin